VLTPFSDIIVLLKKVISIVGIIFGAMPLVYLWLKGFWILGIAFMWLPFLLFCSILYYRTYRKYYASEWSKKFPNEGKFARLWDYRPEKITDKTKEEIYNVATYISQL